VIDCCSELKVLMSLLNNASSAHGGENATMVLAMGSM